MCKHFLHSTASILKCAWETTAFCAFCFVVFVYWESVEKNCLHTLTQGTAASIFLPFTATKVWILKQRLHCCCFPPSWDSTRILPVTLSASIFIYRLATRVWCCSQCSSSPKLTCYLSAYCDASLTPVKPRGGRCSPFKKGPADLLVEGPQCALASGSVNTPQGFPF